MWMLLGLQGAFRGITLTELCVPGTTANSLLGLPSQVRARISPFMGGDHSSAPPRPLPGNVQLSNRSTDRCREGASNILNLTFWPNLTPSLRA